MSPRPTVHTSLRPNTVPWPPLIYLMAILVCVLFEYLFPSTPSLPESLFIRWIGGVIFLCGLGLMFLGVRQFIDIDTPVSPTAQARGLATQGIYSYTRNPIYLGALIGFVGLGLALRSTWLLVSVPVIAVALYKLAISREEIYLEAVFGDAYLRYKAHVRRWI